MKTNKSKKIALFIPCFNEEKRLKIDSIRTFIEENSETFDFYFIDDGSKDATSYVILQNLIDNKYTFLIRLDNNLGKGNALREGILQVKSMPYKYFGFIDADLDIPLKQIKKLHSEIQGTSYLIGVSNRNLFSGFSIFRFRSIGSIAMVTIANQIIQLSPNLKDTQCGCKLFKRELLDIFNDEFISEWLFDIELFLRLKKKFPNARRYIREVPLNDLGRTSKSNFNFFRNLKIFKQLYLINKHYN